MRFDVHGRFQLEVEREDGRWVAYRLGPGTRRPDPSVPIPADVPSDEVGRYLDDLLHELSRDGSEVRRLT